MKAKVFALFLISLSSLAHASEPEHDDGKLLKGHQETKVFIKEVKMKSDDGKTVIEAVPGTYTLDNGVFQLKDGSCVVRSEAVLEPFESVSPEIDFEGAPGKVLHFEMTIPCPA